MLALVSHRVNHLWQLRSTSPAVTGSLRIRERRRSDGFFGGTPHHLSTLLKAGL